MADKMVMLVMVIMMGALALKCLARLSGHASTGIRESRLPVPARSAEDETIDLSDDYRTPISTWRAGASKLPGNIDATPIDDDQSHSVDPERFALVVVSRR